MTDLPGELVGLPEGGPTSVPEVKVWLRIDDDVDDDRLTPIVASVNSMIRSWRVAQVAVGADVWPPRITQGATQLAGRLFRRKNSPAGVEAFGTDGAVYVQRNDPDIAMQLGLGSYQPPTVG